MFDYYINLMHARPIELDHLKEKKSDFETFKRNLVKFVSISDLII